MLHTNNGVRVSIGPSEIPGYSRVAIRGYGDLRYVVENCHFFSRSLDDIKKRLLREAESYEASDVPVAPQAFRNIVEGL